MAGRARGIISDDPQISVLINTYNYGRFLAQAIDSALAQRDVRLEVIVVDDGSTDDTAEVLSRYDGQIRSFVQPNRGQASAINAGVALSRAPLLAFLDADDWWYPGKLLAVVEAFTAQPRAGLVYHRLQPVRNDGSPAFGPIPRSLCKGDLAPRLRRSGGRWPFPMTSSLAVRRSIWDAAGDIPEDFRISADAWITGILPFLTRVAALPAALGAYRIHDNTWYRAQDNDAMLNRRRDHWAETVRITNEVLAAQNADARIQISDHFAYQVAAARLGLRGAPDMLSLIVMGLLDAGEPSPVRRLRDTVAALRDIRRDRARPRSGDRFMKVAVICSEPVDYTIAYINGLAHHAQVTALLPRSRYAALRGWIDHRVALDLIDWPRNRSLRNPAMLFSLTRKIRAAQPDILHLLSNTTLWLNAAAPFWRATPIVTTVHDVALHPGDRDTARLPGWSARLMARQSDHLVVHGAGLRRAAVTAFGTAPERVHVLPHPTIDRYATLAHANGLRRRGPKSALRVLLFGRIFAYKGLATLLQAEALLADRLPNLEIVIAGRGDDPLELAALMGRPERYRIQRGFIPDAEVAQLFTDADIVVLPYDEASQSGVLTISASFGKPVIVTDVGELSPTVKAAQMGLVVLPRAPEALAQALAKLGTDSAARAQLGRAALAWSEGAAAPATVGHQAVRLYDKIVNQRHSPSPN